MANRVVVNICGEEYTFIAEESAVLTAANIADELFKAQAAAEQLRAQIKGYIDEASKAQSEASELKREIFRLQQRLDHQNKG